MPFINFVRLLNPPLPIRIYIIFRPTSSIPLRACRANSTLLFPGPSPIALGMYCPHSSPFENCPNLRLWLALGFFANIYFFAGPFFHQYLNRGLIPTRCNLSIQRTYLWRRAFQHYGGSCIISNATYGNNLGAPPTSSTCPA